MVESPYWQKQTRIFRCGRLEWYAQTPDDGFWAEHWTGQLGAAYYADADRGDLRELEATFLKRMRKGRTYLEAGCGAGYWVAALRARGFSVDGIESSVELVDRVRAMRPDLPIRVADALSIDRPEHHYDGYLSFGVIEHRREGPEPFLLEAFRVLKPGGLLLVSVPFLCGLRRLKGLLGLYPREPPHESFFQYAFSEAELRGLLVKCGFRVDDSLHLHVSRCLAEEVALYYRLNRIKGGYWLRRLVSRAFPARLAGHLLLVTASKP